MNTIGVFTTSEHVAQDKIREILRNDFKGSVSYRRRNSYAIEAYVGDMGNEHTRILWIPPVERSKGHRVNKAYIDKGIEEEELHHILRRNQPYCKEEDVHYF